MTMRIIALMLLFCSFELWAQMPVIDVKGVAKGGAFLKIDGKLSYVGVGRTKGEVKLLGTEYKGAKKGVWLLWQGNKSYQALNTISGAIYEKPGLKVVRLAQGRGGHYYTPGRINTLPVKFLVDTGATSIAMNMPTAKRLGINYRQGRQSWAGTANGNTAIFVVTLKSVSVGGIKLNNIEATVHLGDSPGVVLLGNSFLQKLNMNQDQGVLVLSEKY
jgi:aspartyl protease family protein